MPANAKVGSSDSQQRAGYPKYAGKKPSPVRPLIIEGGALVDPSTGDVTEDAVVVLNAGRVVASGTRDETQSSVAQYSKAARTINVDGKFVLSGLIDVHVHPTSIEGVGKVLRGGATSLRSGSSGYFQDIVLAAFPEWNPGIVSRVAPAGLFVTPNLGDSLLADPALAPLVGIENGITSP